MSFNRGFPNIYGNRGNYFTTGNYLGNSCCKCGTNNSCHLQVRKPPNTPPKPVPPPPPPPPPPVYFSLIGGGQYSSNGNNKDELDDHPGVVLSFINGEWVPFDVTLPSQPIPMPSKNSFNTYAESKINCVSLSSNGNGVGGGYYKYTNGDPEYNTVAMVVSQTDGSWNQAISIKDPTIPESKGYKTIITGISASSNGNAVVCANTKSKFTNNPSFSAYYALCVLNQVNDVWDPSFTIINCNFDNPNYPYDVYPRGFTSISTSSNGNAFAGGYYGHSINNYQSFVISQIDGAWQRATNIIYPPDSVALEQQLSKILSVSCPPGSDGFAIAGGYYRNQFYGQGAMIVSKKGGTLYPAEKIILPEYAAFTYDENATIYSVSASFMFNGIAGGKYRDIYSNSKAMVAFQINGSWNTAQTIQLPSDAATNSQYQQANINAVSMYTDGSGAICGGYYNDQYSGTQAMFVQIIVDDTGNYLLYPAEKVTLPIDAISEYQNAAITSVSSYKDGYGFAMGYYLDINRNKKSMYVNQNNYIWDDASSTPFPTNSNDKASFTTLNTYY
jgi:hypothetical protein